MNENKTNINWYPGHMEKARRQMKENLKLVDLAIEVIDARMPYSSKIVDIDNILGEKRKILVISKMDLCDLKITNKWIEYYEKKGYKVFSLNTLKDNIKPIIKLIDEEQQLMNETRKKKGLKPRKIRIMVVGIPNVGKSTLINRLVGKKKKETGNKPGITKGLDWIRINDKMELLDTPGILWPKIDDNEVGYTLATFTAIKEEILPLEEVFTFIIKNLYKYYPNILKERYDIDNIDDIEEVINTIGKKRYCYLKGGVVNYEQVYHLVLQDVKNGLIPNITFDRRDIDGL